LLSQAHAILSDQGDPHAAARIAARIGEIDWRLGRVDEAFELMENALDVLAAEEADPDVAAVAASLARIYVFTGEMEKAMSRAEIALEHAEMLALSETIADSLNNKSILLQMLKGRHVEAEGLLRHALLIATENDLPIVQIRSHSNLADALQRSDDFVAAEGELRAAIALSRKIGYTNGEAFALSELVTVLMFLGRWDEALEIRKLIPPASTTQGWPPAVAVMLIARGLVADARAVCEPAVAAHRESADLQDRTLYQATEALLLAGEGRTADALALARTLLGSTPTSLRGWDDIGSFELAIETALALGELGQADELLAWAEGLYRGRINRQGSAALLRYRGRIAAVRGEAAAGDHLAGAVRLYREMGSPFPLACTLLELAEWLGDERDAPLLAEARTIFEDLKARPWLDRLAQAEARSSSATDSTW
ncbi:MAG TPA: tetratricopeptide repeat protein, partial [Solirubrobacterales bacterium]|nr:tetratricopeptide repeat protein [Solirubrobacterales bacterium]